MPDLTPVLEILAKSAPELAKWWSERPKKHAAAAAAELMFWPDGMLEELEKIARGDATKKDLKKLREKLLKSQDRVDKIIDDLARSRTTLLKCENGIAVVAQINSLLYQSEIGKRGLRGEIFFTARRLRSRSQSEAECDTRRPCN